MRFQVALILLAAFLAQGARIRPRGEPTVSRKINWGSLEQFADALSEWLAAVEWHGYQASINSTNSGNFFQHIYNSYFASINASNASQPIFNPNSQTRQELKSNLWCLEQLAEDQALTTENKTDWQPFATQLVYAFGNETAAMAYHYQRQKWVVCGYIELKNTFIDGDGTTKLCASCISIGLESPTRTAILGTDYLIPNSSQTDQGYESPTCPGASSLTYPSSRYQSHHSYWKNWNHQGILPTVSAQLYVDLFGSPQMCETIESDDSCASFCCLSEYSSAEFCGGNTGTCFP